MAEQLFRKADNVLSVLPFAGCQSALVFPELIFCILRAIAQTEMTPKTFPPTPRAAMVPSSPLSISVVLHILS